MGLERHEETLEQRSQRLFGQSLDVVIPRLLEEEHSIFRAAIRLEAYPNAVRYWLKRHNLEFASERVGELHKVNPDV